MLESCSDRARQAVSFATAEARRVGHPHVGTEHVLLGLLSGDDEVVGDLLRTAGATLVAARHKVAELSPGEPGQPSRGALPYTSRARRALDRAGRFSRQDRAPEVTTRHVLLGVLDVEGLGCQVLRGLGVDVVQLRKAVVAADTATAGTSDTADTSDTASTDASGTGERATTDVEPEHRLARPSCGRCGAALDDTLAETSMLARRDDGTITAVSVVSCGACGETIGVLPASSA